MFNRVMLLGSLLAAGVSHCDAENWPMWRGPRVDWTSSEENVPIEWSSANHSVWKRTVPGEGHSSPVIREDSLFLTTALKDTEDRCLWSRIRL